MSRRTKSKRRVLDENESAHESAGERLKERVSLGLTLVAVSAFAIFTGYLVGEYAITWIASPLIGEPISGSARSEAESTQFREEGEPAPSTAASSGVTPPAATSSTTSSTTAPSTTTPSTTASSTARTVSQSSATPATASTSAGPAASQGATAGSAAVPAQSVSVHRVQVGRYATRSDAEAVAERLRTGRPAVPDAWVVFDQGAGVYRVQAGAFSARERALEFAAELSAQGYEAFVIP